MKSENSYIKNLIKHMSMEQKTGALLTLGFAGAVPKQNVYDYITKYHCGGLRLSPELRIFGSYVDPGSNRTVVQLSAGRGIKYEEIPPVCTAGEYKRILDDLQKTARERHLSLPLHFSFDQEGGSSADFFFGGVRLFPKPMGIAASGDPHLAYLTARAVAEQAKAVGFNWIHSPVLDINSEPGNPEIVTRAYSDSAEVVAEYALEACRGYRDGGVIATGKHFPGRGASTADAHYQIPVIDVDFETLWNRELLPYRKLIAEAALPAIMVAHSIFPAIDPDCIATVSRPVLTGLLREKMGFQGIIATDSMTMGGVAMRYGAANACAMALEAGADLVLMKAENDLVEETVRTIIQYAESGRIPGEELDRKVYRVLNAKYEQGLFYEGESKIPPETVLNREDIKALAEYAARKSVMVLRNRHGLLPLTEGERVLVVEQKVKHYNSLEWHSGILYEQCMRWNRNTDYLETGYIYDEADKQRIRKALTGGGKVVITNYYLRSKLSNKAFLEEIKEEWKDKAIIVTNTPYDEISIPQGAEHVVVTYATSPENIKATAGLLFGKQKSEAMRPY